MSPARPAIGEHKTEQNGMTMQTQATSSRPRRFRVMLVSKRTAKRFALIAASAVGLVMATALPATAATSQAFVYHADGAVAGEVWFNSGYHAAHQGHPQHGFNSFTIKDEFCGDGWGVGVQWQLLGQTYTHQGTKDCDPVEVNYATNQAVNIVIPFSWRPFKWAVDFQHADTYGAWQNDWMGSASVDESDKYFSWTSVYSDVVDGRHTFTASMRPTPYARLIGSGETPQMARDLMSRTPFPSSLTLDQWDSLYKQLWCHAVFGKTPEFGGPTWDIEASRPNIPWSAVKLLIAGHHCNW
jgi:hypothetical protein